MLRSIFSLIHRIIDSSEKKYNNTKSKAVIYCFTNPDETVNMNLEINGTQRKTMKSLEQKDTIKHIEPNGENSFKIETDLGDVVTCKHKNPINIVPKGSKDALNRVTFSNPEEKSGEIKSEVDLEVQPNVRDLILNFSKKRVEVSPKEKDQISLLLEQIQKMKTGLERLQEIAKQFNYSERFSEDINYLVNNVRPYLKGRSKKSDTDKNNISPKV